MTGLRLAPVATAPEISVVVPVYNEAGNVAELSAEIVFALRREASFEIVFVDDGSTDATAAELVRLAAIHPELRPVSHGNALSVYFLDPEGNRIELFVDTPWYCRQPVRIPMNISLSEEEIWAWAESEARKQPDFMPVDEWRAKQARAMHTG